MFGAWFITYENVDNVNQKRNYGALKLTPKLRMAWRLLRNHACENMTISYFSLKANTVCSDWHMKMKSEKTNLLGFLYENYVYLYENLYGFLFLIIFNVNKWEFSYEKWYLRYFFCRKSYYRGSKFM